MILNKENETCGLSSDKAAAVAAAAQLEVLVKIPFVNFFFLFSYINF